MEKNRYTLITGASNGIGLEFAKIHASKGENLVLVARSEAKLKEIKKEFEQNYTIQLEILVLDLSKENAAQMVFEFTQSKNIIVSILINNAGFGDFGFFHESNWEKTNEMIQLNITCLTQLTHVYAKEMVRYKHGKILNVSSIAAFQPGPMMSVYFATKAFVLHFSEAINNELKEFGVSVTALCPGPTASSFFTVADMENAKLIKDKKLPSPKEVAEFGSKALMNNNAVAVHGFFNNFLVNLVRFTPRNLVVKITRMMQG
jgi:short-subunit dehydrogenase